MESMQVVASSPRTIVVGGSRGVSSLSGSRSEPGRGALVRSQRLYSTPAFAVCSLFGGPLSAIAFAAIQSRAMGRLWRDLPWIVLGVLLFLVAASFAASLGLLREALADLGTQHVPVLTHVSYRAAALLFFYAYWRRLLPDRDRLIRAGVTVEPGYVVGLVALLVGLVGGTVVLLALRR
jgi:hypothetical protein